MRTSFSPWRKRNWARLLLSTQPRYPVPLPSCSSSLPSFHDRANTLNSGLSPCMPLIPLPVKCPPPLESRTLVPWLRRENGEPRSWLKAQGWSPVTRCLLRLERPVCPAALGFHPGKENPGTSELSGGLASLSTGPGRQMWSWVLGWSVHFWVKTLSLWPKAQ